MTDERQVNLSNRSTYEVNESMYDKDAFVGSFKPTVSILGTFHFTNYVQHDYEDGFLVDGLSNMRQEELEELIDKLASFQPSKILIERNRKNRDSAINRHYHAFKSMDSVVQINDEVYLIAFPLAKKMGHDRVFSSDAEADWFGAELDWETFDERQYLKGLGQLTKSQRYHYEEVYKKEDSLKSALSLLDYYRIINAPDAQLYNHQIYLTETVLTGAGDNYIGADAVARWYRRNLRIFSNVLDLVSFEKEERILLIYGASHTWTLKQFFEDSPDFNYVEINQFLN